MNKKVLQRIGIILLYGILAGIGVNCFLTPAKVYSGGVTGLSMLLSSIGNDFIGVNIDISAWVLIINLPLLYLSWKKLGNKFTIYSLLAVISASLFIKVIPETLITENIFLAAIFGGALTGVGSGLCFRAGFSTAGTDIIVLVVQKLTGKSVGVIGFILNGIIVSLAGIMYGVEMGLYSLVSIFATTKLVDIFYVQQYNTNDPLSSIVTVISKHELLFIKKVLMEVDEEAFINVQPTVEVVGKFIDKSLI